MNKLIDFTVKTFVIGIVAYLFVVAIFMGVFNIFDRIDNLLAIANAQSELVDKYIETIFSTKSENGTEFTLLKWGIAGIIENPEVHYRLAKQYEARGDLEKAVLAASLAVALVDPDVKKYKDTYHQLQNEINKANMP